MSRITHETHGAALDRAMTICEELGGLPVGAALRWRSAWPRRHVDGHIYLDIRGRAIQLGSTDEGVERSLRYLGTEGLR